MSSTEFDRKLRKYEQEIASTRAARMQWWQEARFGMFIHWGLYSQIARHEWVMNREGIPVAEYERYAARWKPRPHAPRKWARLAREAGMKYMVMTTKHHEGFLLWNSRMSRYNAVECGPRRDLVADYVEAARAEGLRVGFYYSLMDWHHPDGEACKADPAARKRFLEYTHGCVRELCSNYGKIDILWYDVAWPLASPEEWDSLRMNTMVRELQPHILINDRSYIPEDFTTPEENIQASPQGRAWEACMTFNRSWGWQPCPDEDWLSVRDVLGMLCKCAAGGGNLLLNVGPLPDGSVPPQAVKRLTKVGRWLEANGEAVFGRTTRFFGAWLPTGLSHGGSPWTRKGNSLYFWCGRWPGRELTIRGLCPKVLAVKSVGNQLRFKWRQKDDRLILTGLPVKCPDPHGQTPVFKIDFDGAPTHTIGCSCRSNSTPFSQVSGLWFSPHLPTWHVSSLQEKKTPDAIAQAEAVSLADSSLSWTKLGETSMPGFIDIHPRFHSANGIVYFANRFRTKAAGEWTLHVGHDGGIRLFVDGKPCLCVPATRNPAEPNRSQTNVRLAPGEHEIVIAFDTNCGRGYGILMCFGIPGKKRKAGITPQFPELIDPGD
jgi:alpha-L-fucosidase